MDLLLKALGVTRSFGSESLKVTSLGAPVSESAHRDKYGRRWTVATFALPYMDMHLVALFLPTPDGYAGMLQLAARDTLEMTQDQLRFCSDYFYVSYSGTLPQWQAYLARADLRPTAFDHLKVTRDVGGLHVQSRRIDFDLPSTLLTLDDSSKMQIQMSYALERGAAVWDAGAIYVSSDEDSKTYIGVIRQPKPAQTAGKELNDRWMEMLASKGDFIPERGHDSDYKKLWRRAAVGAGYKPGASVDPAATLLYEVVSMVQDAKLPKRIDDMQDLLLENVRVKER
jgi:serine protease Do